jgi:hypothetical protein
MRTLLSLALAFERICFLIVSSCHLSGKVIFYDLAECIYCHSGFCGNRWGINWMIGFSDHFNTQLVTTINYNAIAILLTYLLPEKLPIVQPFRKFRTILRNPQVRHHIHKSSPLVPILSQFDPLRTIPSYLSKIHFNIVHPPTSWSS